MLIACASITLIYQSLMRFLATLQIPIVASFRDSQNYIRGAELGLGIHEMKPYLVREDTDQWDPLVKWLEERGSCCALFRKSLQTPGCGWNSRWSSQLKSVVEEPAPDQEPGALSRRLFLVLVERAADLVRPVLVVVPAVQSCA